MSLSKKNIIIFVVIILVLVLAIGFLFTLRKPLPTDLSKAPDKEIAELLRKNEDNNNYMNTYPDFIIKDKLVLTKEAILEGQNGQNFKEVYQGLELEGNRYLKIDLMNPAGDRGMVTVLDIKKGEVLRAFGIMLLSNSVSPK